MKDLFERVLHHIEGNETEIQSWETKDGKESYAIKSFGPDRWIERAALGRVMAIDLLAVILFSVRDSFNLEGERRIVEGWAAELRKAAASGEIQARDPVTLLALETLPEGWEWLVSITDADKFIAVRGMGWSCSEQVEYLLEQSRKEGKRYRDAKTGELQKHYWLAGYEPMQEGTLPQAADTKSPGWMVNKPKRFQGYTQPLYNVLKDAHTKGQTLPTVYEVLEIFEANQPSQVAKVLPGEGLDYYTEDPRVTTHASLKAIRSAIGRMTSKKPR